MEFEEFIEEWHSATPFIEAHTSGSTGKPKRILLPKDFVRESAVRTNRFFSVTSESRLHSCVAADFVGGKMMAVRADMAGCRLTWERPTNRPLSGIGINERIDLLAVVPSQMLHILDHPDDMPELGAIIIGGSAIDRRLYDRICDSGLDAYESYGMTETASHIALKKVEKGAEWFAALPGITVGVDDRGCLVISFSSGESVVTNDLADVEGDTRFRIRGRADHVIVTGGRKVNPFDIERRISRFIDRPFVVTSEPDEKWGRRVVLRIEVVGGIASEASVLLQNLKDILEPYEIPKKIEYVETLPRTANGKLIR